MGQYWIPVNLDKKEFIDPHKLASGLKLWEQIANQYVGSALIILTAAQKEARGGGDLDITENWHGPERTFPEHNTHPGPMSRSYMTVAKETIGRWAGDRIAIVGDYAEDADLPEEFEASKIYERCRAEYEYYDDMNPEGALWKTKEGMYRHQKEISPAEFKDISNDVCRVIEHELKGKFTGNGWRQFEKGE